jgi:hypothetical protein
MKPIFSLAAVVVMSSRPVCNGDVRRGRFAGTGGCEAAYCLTIHINPEHWRVK